MIRDDELFALLISELPKDVHLTCVMDCCHSGSILDLPFMFVADDDNLAPGASHSTTPNANFDWKKMLKTAQKLYEMKQKGASHMELFAHAKKNISASDVKQMAELGKKFGSLF